MEDVDRGVLILTSDVGGGHRSVALALAEALEPFHVKVSIVDVIAQGLPSPLNRIGGLYGPLVNGAPLIWHALYHLTEGQWRTGFLLRCLKPLFFKRLISLLATTNPDVVVSTHPLANHLTVWALQRTRRVPVVTMITDLVTLHPLWICSEVDLCLVPTEEARREALNWGIPGAKVKVVGLPVGLAFTKRVSDRDAVRAELGLARHLFTVLISGGGEGIGELWALVKAVAKAGLGVQLIVVAGRNRKLKDRLEERAWEIPIHVTGFTERMPALMRAADCIITKAGPSTMSEALVCGLPLIITSAIPGQEEANVDYVVQSGAGIYTPTPEKAVAALKEFIASPGTLEQMRKAAWQLAHPQAAEKAARLIASLAR
ncbi:MAG TPA: galactosyldiacylglycerol synthase [Chloroflexi bacterium]|nr:galactosyldiacylglycerol synthase [Chloroflexota bacterium]